MAVRVDDLVQIKRKAPAGAKFLMRQIKLKLQAFIDGLSNKLIPLVHLALISKMDRQFGCSMSRTFTVIVPSCFDRCQCLSQERTSEN